MLVQMLQRNMGVKRAPERWQDNRDVFDAVVTFDERIMEQLLDGDTFLSLISMRNWVLVSRTGLN
jgi:hypothetical protein